MASEGSPSVPQQPVERMTRMVVWVEHGGELFSDLADCNHDFQMHPVSEDFGVCSICGAEMSEEEPGCAG